MHRDERGFVSVDHDKCVGCKYCELACPYNVPSFDEELGQMRKCDGCSSRVAKGENPICVDACPLYALDFGPADEMKKKYGESEWLAPLPDPSYTEPSTIMKGCSISRNGGTYEGQRYEPEGGRIMLTAASAEMPLLVFSILVPAGLVALGLTGLLRGLAEGEANAKKMDTLALIPRRCGFGGPGSIRVPP